MLVQLFPKGGRHTASKVEAGSGGYRSGLNSDRGIPVARSISTTRSAGIDPSSQRNTVVLFTSKNSARRSSVNGGLLANRNLRMGLSLLITQHVARNATLCQDRVAFGANDLPGSPWQVLGMGKFHYIPEWAHQADKIQADIVEATGADKANVSRWWDGVIPTNKYLELLAPVLGAPEPAALFVHPAEYKILVEIRALTVRSDTAA